MSLHSIKDNLDVPLAYLGSLLILGVERYMGIVALFVTIVYTLWKWSTEIIDRYKSKKEKSNEVH